MSRLVSPESIRTTGWSPYAWTRPRHALFALDVSALAVFLVLIWGGFHDVVERNVPSSTAHHSHDILLTVLVVSVLFIMAWNGEYSGRRRFSRVNDLVVAVKAMLLAGLFAIALAYVSLGFGTRFTSYSRLVLVVSAATALLFFCMARLAMWAWQARLFRRGMGMRRLVVAGVGASAADFERFLLARDWLGYQCVGSVAVLDMAPESDRAGGVVLSQRVLGQMADLPGVLAETGAEEVVVALDRDEQAQLPVLTRLLVGQCIPFRVVPDLFEAGFGEAHALGLGGLDVVSLHTGHVVRAKLIVKRLGDIVMASLALIVLAPFLMAVALAVRMESAGAALYTQERVGMNGRPFQLYKFRTMYVGADRQRDRLAHLNEGNEALFKIRSDPRITRVGRFLRRWSVDEAPQFLNVLKGDMSVVGPRPPLPDEVAMYTARDATRLTGKPGITGLWQVSGRSNLSVQKMVELDRYYLENWSLSLDVSILMRTVAVVLTRHGAY